MLDEELNTTIHKQYTKVGNDGVETNDPYLIQVVQYENTKMVKAFGDMQDSIKDSI